MIIHPTAFEYFDDKSVFLSVTHHPVLICSLWNIIGHDKPNHPRLIKIITSMYKLLQVKNVSFTKCQLPDLGTDLLIH